MTTWRSRIVETGTADPKTLVVNPKNWRKHPKHQADALSGVLGEIGWLQDVIVNRTTGRLVDGHLRVELAIREKQTEVPVTYVDLTEAEEALALATFDPISAMATADAETLRTLLDDVSTGDAALQQMIANLAAKERLIPISNDHRPIDMTVDHTAMIKIENDDSKEKFLPEHSMARYETTGIRQIMLIMDEAEYDFMLNSFRAIIQDRQLDTNLQVVRLLLDHYLATHGGV